MSKVVDLEFSQDYWKYIIGSKVIGLEGLNRKRLPATPRRILKKRLRKKLAIGPQFRRAKPTPPKYPTPVRRFSRNPTPLEVPSNREVRIKLESDQYPDQF
jgi:hypothetical protein